jgi:uncharacterized Fe-S cluster protein YjdI
MKHYALFNYIGEIQLSLKVAKMCSHSGQCVKDVKKAMQLPEVKKELAKIDPAKLVKELSEYGAWEIHELLNHTENLERILWIAAGNILEENN